MCEPRQGPRRPGTTACTCGCCGCGPSFRRFFSSDEERECLETYTKQLEKELSGVQERIKELKAG